MNKDLIQYKTDEKGNPTALAEFAKSHCITFKTATTIKAFENAYPEWTMLAPSALLFAAILNKLSNNEIELISMNGLKVLGSYEHYTSQQNKTTYYSIYEMFLQLVDLYDPKNMGKLYSLCIILRLPPERAITVIDYFYKMSEQLLGGDTTLMSLGGERIAQMANACNIDKLFAITNYDEDSHKITVQHVFDKSVVRKLDIRTITPVYGIDLSKAKYITANHQTRNRMLVGISVVTTSTVRALSRVNKYVVDSTMNYNLEGELFLYSETTEYTLKGTELRYTHYGKTICGHDEEVLEIVEKHNKPIVDKFTPLCKFVNENFGDGISAHVGSDCMAYISLGDFSLERFVTLDDFVGFEQAINTLVDQHMPEWVDNMDTLIHIHPGIYKMGDYGTVVNIKTEEAIPLTARLVNDFDKQVNLAQEENARSRIAELNKRFIEAGLGEISIDHLKKARVPFIGSFHITDEYEELFNKVEPHLKVVERLLAEEKGE